MAPPILQVDPVICHCLRVTESTVGHCVTLMGATNLREVREACGAGGGCMSCRRRIQNVIDNYARERQSIAAE